MKLESQISEKVGLLILRVQGKVWKRGSFLLRMELIFSVVRSSVEGRLTSSESLLIAIMCFLYTFEYFCLSWLPESRNCSLLAVRSWKPVMPRVLRDLMMQAMRVLRLGGGGVRAAVVSEMNLRSFRWRLLPSMTKWSLLSWIQSNWRALRWEWICLLMWREVPVPAWMNL